MLLATTFNRIATLTEVCLLLLIVEAGEPSRETLHRSLKFGMEVDEGAHLIGEPGKRHFILAAACLELLDTPIGEVHSVPRLGSRTARECWCRRRSSRNAIVAYWIRQKPMALRSSFLRSPARASDAHRDFLGSAVGSSRLCERGLHQGTLLLQVHRG
jgi:hypothetical protein